MPFRCASYHCFKCSVRIFLTLVVKDSKVLKAVNPGDSIRYEPRQKGLFEPLSIESWTKKYMVAPVELGGTVPYLSTENQTPRIST